MFTRNAALIANPKAGSGHGLTQRRVGEFCDTLAAKNVGVEVVWTTRPNDAAVLAATAVQNGATDIVIHGGDGTINEALQGLIGLPVRVAIWPGGTANVLARELHMPASAVAIANVVADATTKLLYLGKATEEESGKERYFLLMAGIGLDASVVYGVHPNMKRLIGKAAFWYTGLGHLFHWQPEVFHLEAGGTEFPATFAAIGNGPRYGGDLSITPRAQLDEPDFEICLINTKSRLRYLSFLASALGKGLSQDGRDVKFLRTRRARVKGNAPVQVDGELIGRLPMSFEIVDWRMEVIVPQEILVTPHLVPASQPLRNPATPLESLAGSSL
jgi:diacylglycerol kinase (ATP)